ncbi:MAG: hypothetical protein AB7G17_02030 [Phycisphaerales bacterium]
MDNSPIHERLHTLLGHETYRVIGERTGFHPENVRRYMQGQTPPIQFIAAVCASTGASADWLLTGHIIPRAPEERIPKDHAPEHVLASLSHVVETLTDRVERLERYIQTLETKLRASAAPSEPPHDRPDPTAQTRRQTTAPRPSSIADALPPGPRPPPR